MKVTVIMGVEKFWVRADVELEEYDDAHQGAILTHALMSAGDQAMSQWREVAANGKPST